MSASSQTLETAFQHHLAGQLDQARTCYEQVVAQHSRHAAALHGLAMIACAQQQYDSAAHLAERAIEAQPDIATFYNTLGIAYDTLGQKEQALHAFRQAVTLKPDHAEAYHNMGVSLLSLHQYDAAIEQCRKAMTLNPQLVKAYVTLARCFQAQGDRRQAIHYFEQAVQIDADLLEAYVELAHLYQGQEQLECAATALQRIVQIGPASAEVHTRLGMILRQLGQDREARQHYMEALRLKPGLAEAHNNLGNLLNQHGLYQEALHHYEQATQANAHYAESFNNLAATLIHLNRLADAVTHCHKAITLKPAYAEAHNTLASAYMKQGRYQEAKDKFMHTLALNPEYAEAHSNLGMIHLVLGEFDAGWREYEWRLKSPVFRQRYTCKQPRWDGTPFPGKTLLVHYEQGMGDSMQFIRYLPKVKALGGTVLYQDRPPLKTLFQKYPGIDRFICLGDTDMPQFDMQASVMSLPFLLGTQEHNIPATSVYLKAEVEKIKRMQAYIQSHDFNVGIVWAGSKVHKNNRNRSCDPALFRSLAQCPGIGLYGLQRPDSEPAAPDCLADLLVTNLGEHFQDFSDTAGAIAHMDLILSVDTSVLHLACAMGKPTWALLPYVPDWRWMLDRTDSPWYPTLRLFRQSRPGQWQPVFDAVAESLNHTLQLHRSR
ncbi:MAG: tetratricopeptide repeat protein [Phycisphaerae bacterium]|nr:tetratricopeptide repeat protein [Phycisphaerae bacterium]